MARQTVTSFGFLEVQSFIKRYWLFFVIPALGMRTVEGISFSPDPLRRLALRGRGTGHARATLMAGMQQTYGNLHTRRAVQRAVVVKVVFSGMGLDREDLLKMRQRDMSYEEKVADRAEAYARCPHPEENNRGLP